MLPLLVAFLHAAFGQPLAPPTAPPPAAIPPDRLALTISGGATLGVHEAGTLYLLGQAAEALSPGPELVLATGASAGSGNTLLAVLELCGQPAADPADSLGWQLWVDNGLDAITPPGHRSPTALFSQEAMFQQRDRVAERWSAGLRDGCAVTVSLPVTRLESEEVTVADHLHLPRQTMRFVVRIDGHGPGTPPSISTVRLPGSAQLPLTGDPLDDLALLWEVVVASAAFPFAFEPVRLGYCAPEAPRCDEAERVAWFVDGGVFDNVPLRMAHRLTADVPGVRHVYLDPAIRAWPTPAPPGGPPGALDLAGYIAHFAGGFVSQARSHEVFALAEDDPEVVSATHVMRSRFPQAGAHLGNFFGLFDQDLRAFDFTLGMYDAWHALDALAGPGAREAVAPRLGRPGWRRLACLRSWADGEEALRSACEGDELHDFRVLVAVAIAHAAAACSDPAVAAQAGPEHHVCARAGEQPAALLPLLPGLTDPAQVLRQPGESDLDWTLRLMAAGGYRWTELGLEGDEADRAAGAMADRLAGSIRAMARAQGDPVQGRLLAVAGEQALAHSLAPPTDPRRLYLLGGTVAEVGASAQVAPGLPWARAHAMVQGDGLVSALTRDGEELSVSPGVGVELDPTPRSTGLLAPVFGARMTWQLGAADRGGAGSCAETVDPRLCSQGVVQGYGAVTVLGVFRTQVEVDVHPWLPGDGPRYDLQIAVGPEF